MGERTDQAERDVVEQRELINRRIGELKQRVDSDVDAVGHRVGEQASRLNDRVSEATDKVPGKQMLEQQVPAHPLTSLLGGFGVGIALGMLSGGSGDTETSERSRARPAQQSSSAGGGLTNGLAGMALTAIAGPIQRELTGALKQAVDGFVGRGQSTQPKADATPRPDY